ELRRGADHRRLRAVFPEHGADHDPGYRRQDAVLLAGRVRLRPAALVGPRYPLSGHAVDADAAAAGHLDPAVRDLQAAWLGRHLPAFDRAELLRRPVLYVLAAAILSEPADRA